MIWSYPSATVGRNRKFSLNLALKSYPPCQICPNSLCKFWFNLTLGLIRIQGNNSHDFFKVFLNCTVLPGNSELFWINSDIPNANAVWKMVTNNDEFTSSKINPIQCFFEIFDKNDKNFHSNWRHFKRRALTLSDDVIDEDFHLPIRIQLQKTEFLPLKSSRKFVLSTLFWLLYDKRSN